MILVDKQICEKVKSNQLIESFNANNVQSICYDLTTDKFIDVVDGVRKPLDMYSLPPQQSIFVASRETIKFDFNMLGRVVGRNSRIREGLRVDAPIYQPGHYTKIYFRLTNVSNTAIELSSGKSYASIMFELLEEAPDKTYNGTFQHELDYSHLGDYSSEYSREVSKFDKKLEEFKELEKNVYGNVLTLLTIFITIFTIININVGFVSSTDVDWKSFLLFNLCTIGSISLLSNLIASYLQNKSFFKRLWLVPVLCFAFAILIVAKL